jgi:anti-sigma regulatory factor (Ser/Thr protein kinase)
VPSDIATPDEPIVGGGARRLLGNAPIRYKLWAILVVPLAAVVLFATLQISASTAEASSAQQVQALAKLGVKISALAHELQQERGQAARLLGSQKPSEEFTYESQYRATDSAISSYRDEKDALSGDQSEPVVERLGRVEEQLRGLTVLRRSIVNGVVAQAQATFRYTTLISDLLAINEAIAGATDDTSVADRVRATAAFSRLKEFVSQEQAILFEVLTAQKFEAGQYRNFINSLANQEAHLIQFADAATPEQRALMDETLTRPLVEDSTKLEQTAIRGENATKLDIGERNWFAATTKKINLLRQVEIQLGRNVVSVSGALRDDAMKQSMINIGLVLLTLIAALTISLMVARSMVRPLIQLRSSALEVANHSLPEVVRRLRDSEDTAPEVAGQRPDTPGGVDPELVQAVEIKSNDEIGQVARAFNAVHLEAVRVATEQAQLRRSVSTMFVNLSRRSQLLVDRLIRLIDSLEQGEQDPDRLSDLFKLDHLATRMRRNDENLLVLAGADAGRRWNQPAPLVDVLRAATAEVEQYTRVRLGTVDESIEVAARAVNDVVHLVAELLENATSFSSPRTDVIVDARRVGDQAIIEIEDQGIGMSRQQMTELNERLTKPPVFDVSVSRMMGLFVVGRLANRHNVKVMLRGASSGGTLAIVTLSAEVLNLSRFQRPTLAGADQAQALPAAATIDSSVVESTTTPAPVGLAGPPAQPALPAGAPSGVSMFEKAARKPAEAAPTADAKPAAPPAKEHPTEPLPEPASAQASGLGGPSSAAAAMALLASQPPVDVEHANGTTTPQFLSSPSDPPSADPTIEMPLPIFDAIESEWFRSSKPVPTTADAETAAPEATAPPAEPKVSEPWPVEPKPYKAEPAPAAAAPAEAKADVEPEVKATEKTSAAEPPTAPARPAAKQAEPTDAPAPAAASQEATNGAAVTKPGASPADRGDETDRPSQLRQPAAGATPTGLPTRQPGASEPIPASGTERLVPAAAASAGNGVAAAANGGSTPSNGAAETKPAEPAWASPADAGWKAAQAVAAAKVEASTPSGLPKRVPMANFVPGRVDQPAQRRAARPTTQRSPDAVRGVLSSYRSGLEQGRQVTKARHSATGTELDEQEEM